MIAVDTNVLIRVVVDDPGQPQQVARARRQVKAAGRVFIPQVVQAELVWVLEDAFGASKPEIVGLLRHLLTNQAFVLQNEASFESALAQYETGSADFADYLILAEARSAGYPLITFDKRLQRAEGVQALAD